MDRGKQRTTLGTNYEDARSIMVPQICEDLALCPRLSQDSRALFADPDVPKLLVHKTGFVFAAEEHRAEFRVQLGALISAQTEVLPEDSLEGPVAEVEENISGYLTMARSQRILEALPPLFRSAFIAVLRQRSEELVSGTVQSCEEANRNGQDPPYDLPKLKNGLRKAVDTYCAEMLREGDAEAGA